MVGWYDIIWDRRTELYVILLAEKEGSSNLPTDQNTLKFSPKWYNFFVFLSNMTEILQLKVKFD